MAKFKIPVSWTMIADMVVEADNLADAIRRAEVADLPDGAEYCDSSFEVNTELLYGNPEVYGEIKPKTRKATYGILHESTIGQVHNFKKEL